MENWIYLKRQQTTNVIYIKRLNLGFTPKFFNFNKKDQLNFMGSTGHMMVALRGIEPRSQP